MESRRKGSRVKENSMYKSLKLYDILTENVTSVNGEKGICYLGLRVHESQGGKVRPER